MRHSWQRNSNPSNSFSFCPRRPTQCAALKEFRGLGQRVEDRVPGQLFSDSGPHFYEGFAIVTPHFDFEGLGGFDDAEFGAVMNAGENLATSQAFDDGVGIASGNKNAFIRHPLVVPFDC